VQARYENGTLQPDETLPLRPGERVGVIVLRKGDAVRWKLDRLAAGAAQDEAMARAGLEQWVDALNAMDRH
jgi:predicted DNA-binding antitoxin AbrB/MazE fold protein